MLQEDNRPYLSVIICTYNRQKFIGACLQCLALQTLPKQYWEVLVVDNNSTDQSATIIQNFISNDPELPFTYIFEGQQGLSFARNRGIAESRGDVLVYIDDDVEVTPEYLQVIKDFFETHPQIAGVGGRTLPKFSEGPPPAWLNPYMTGITGTIDKGLAIKKFVGKMKYPVGCNMIYTKQVLQQAGGFNNQLKARADDKYIFEKVSKISNEIWYVPQAFSLHNIDADRLTFTSFKRLYTKGGNEEKIKTRGEGTASYMKKGLDLLIKLFAGLAIWFWYILKGRALAGRYIFMAQWFTLKGFFS
jgi:glucosyl-dolichyl phosphate glucuronosyltransferase